MKQKIWSQQCLQANTRPRITGRVKIWRSIDSCLDNYFHHIPRILIVCGSGLANCHSPPPTWSTGPILPFSINRNVFNYLQIHAVIPGKKGTQAVQIPHSWGLFSTGQSSPSHCCQLLQEFPMRIKRQIGPLMLNCQNQVILKTDILKINVSATEAPTMNRGTWLRSGKRHHSLVVGTDSINSFYHKISKQCPGRDLDIVLLETQERHLHTIFNYATGDREGVQPSAQHMWSHIT